jgi:hypothetical protein
MIKVIILAKKEKGEEGPDREQLVGELTGSFGWSSTRTGVTVEEVLHLHLQRRQQPWPPPRARGGGGEAPPAAPSSWVLHPATEVGEADQGHQGGEARRGTGAAALLDLDRELA